VEEPTNGEGRPVAAAVIVHNRRVLLVRRRVREGRLAWQFPAGKVEPGESASEAAVREALEEVGLAVRAIGSLGERVHPDTGRTMYYVPCSVASGTARVASEGEVAEATWCSHDDISAYIPYPLYEPVQEYLNNELR
jgi:8-oxo-dGTP diphosphatase